MRAEINQACTPKLNQLLKLLISSAPGIGKMSLVEMVARALASHPVAIEDVKGKEV